MALRDFFNKLATITQESHVGDVPSQDILGGADRSATNWFPVMRDVPCMVRPVHTRLDARNDARTNAVLTYIYFAFDPVETGLSTRHRITIGDRIYAVQGVIDFNSRGQLFRVLCEWLNAL